MIRNLADFVGFRVGDIISLSDLQTQTEYNAMSVDFIIREVRTYSEPNSVFTYYGYQVEAPNATHDLYLILFKTMQGKTIHIGSGPGSDVPHRRGDEPEAFEAYVFFKDTGASGPLFNALEGQDPCPLMAFFNDEKKDFTPRFEAQVTDATGTHAVTWDRQVSSYGVDFASTSDGKGLCSLGEYYTDDENGGNSYCLLDWKGDTTKGYIETWYGCPVKNSEIALFHK